MKTTAKPNAAGSKHMGVIRPMLNPILLGVIFVGALFLALLVSCSNESNLRSDVAPIKKRLPMVNEIISAQWKSERVPAQDSLLSPPTLDVFYVIKGVIVLKNDEYNALVDKYDDWVSCDINNEATVFNMHEERGISSSHLVEFLNYQIKPNFLRKFIFLRKNKIYIELECRR